MPKIYNLTDTWNDGSTVFDAIKINVADSASSAGSKLIDLQVGGVSKFKVDKEGNATSTGDINGASPTEMGYLSGVASNIQTQIDAKVTNVDTNLSTTQTTTTVDVVSSDGTDATLPQAIASGNAGVMSGADKAKLDGISGTNTGDDAVNSLYSGLVTNATHTGEVTGDTALTVDKTLISGKTDITTPATDDYVLVGDTSDTDNLKKVTAQSIADLGGGGGAFGADANTLITASTPIVLDQATGDEAALTLDYTTNKATSGNDTGLLINQTDTLSPGTSNLLDLQVGGVSKISMDAGANISGIFGYGLALRGGGTCNLPNIHFLGRLRFVNGTDLNTDAANTLGQRNGVNAQTFNIYNTYTNASNYERGHIGWNDTADTFVIGTEAAGTGVGRDVELKRNGASSMILKSGGLIDMDNSLGSNRIQINHDSNTPYVRVTQSTGKKTSYYPHGLTSTAEYNIIAANGLGIGIATPTVALDVSGSIAATGTVKTTPTTVGALPAAATAGAGARTFVTDSANSLSSHHGQTVTGGGTDFSPVYSDGTTWRVG